MLKTATIARPHQPTAYQHTLARTEQLGRENALVNRVVSTLRAEGRAATADAARSDELAQAAHDRLRAIARELMAMRDMAARTDGMPELFAHDAIPRLERLLFLSLEGSRGGG